MSTYPIDLSEILFRAYEEGDLPPAFANLNPLAASSTYPILLDAIKFRAWQDGENENDLEEEV